MQRIQKEGSIVFFAKGEFEKQCFIFFSPTAHQKPRNYFMGLQPKTLRAPKYVLRCDQPGPPRLFRKTAILTEMLRQRDSAAADYVPGTHTGQVVIDSHCMI